MKIVYLASEVYPFYKSGGLADIMYSLPKKMSELGNDVTVIMPKYDIIKLKYLEKITFVDRIEINGEIINLVKYEDDSSKVKYLFIENQKYFERGRVYGDMDEDYQYALFSEAVLIFLKRQNLQADILHCNDWQTGPVPYFLKERYKKDPFYWDMRVVYTIHNLMYQGRFNNYSFDKLGYYRDSNYLNFMEIGMSYADVVSTVSPTYANEIKYSYFGEGLEGLASYKNVRGILNGIDEKLYDPMNTEGVLPFNAESLENKKKNKEILQEKFGFEKKDSIVISLVSRFVEGKGLDLIKAKIDELLKDEVQVIFLGTGSKDYEDYFRHLEYVYPHKFKAYIGYSEDVSKLIFAGSDLLLIPSRYEPCGLTQMIAMRYGTIPLVRETGGLKDSVKAYNFINDEGNGFTFTNFNADDLLYTIRLAEHVYYDRKDIWDKLVLRNLAMDNSWEKSSKEYLELYKFAKTTP